MKNELINILAICVLSILFSIFIVGIIIIKGQQDYHQAEMEAIQARTCLDSLYFDHVKECSFINKEDVKVDENGYFYSAYWKEYK